MFIVAISAWKQSGKDTLAAHLVKNHSFTQISFARPLKDAVALNFNVDRDSMDDSRRKEAPLLSMPAKAVDAFTRNLAGILTTEFRTAAGQQPKHVHFPDGSVKCLDTDEQLYWTPRALCILEGSSKRSADPDYWVKKLMETARQTDPNGLFVISDLRYKNEIEALESSLGEEDEMLVMRINRFEDSPSKDASERDLDNYNFSVVLENKGITLEEFLKRGTDIVVSRLQIIEENNAGRRGYAGSRTGLR